MRTRVTLLLVGIFVLSAIGVISAGISGSKHDFSGAAWNNGGVGEICQPCHTPHNASTDPSGPLWNHSNTLTAASTFGYYTNSTMNATDIGDPSGVSMACLSCHDGTVAMDAFGGAAGTPGSYTMEIINSDKSVGLDLSNDHPISFTYDPALASADGGLHNPTNKVIADLLIGGKLECSSCHDVHGSPVAATNLLTIDNAGSLLCLTCHDK